MIADVVSRAVDHLLQVRTEEKMSFRLVMQIHDAIILEVPYREVERVVDYVLPESMRTRVPIYPTGLNGKPVGNGPFHLGLDTNCYRHWGIQLYPEQLLEMGLSPRMGGWLDLPSGGWKHPGKAGKIWLRGAWHATAAQP